MNSPWYLRYFRKARPAEPVRNLARTATQTILFWGVFLGLIPWAIHTLEGALGIPGFAFPGQPVAPWLLFAIAGSFGLTSGATMALRGAGTPVPLEGPRRLVVQGPYAYLRNPMAVAGLTQGACVGAYLGSYSTLGYVLAGGLLWNYAVRPIEERYMEHEFGEEFRAYRDAVPCWWPRPDAYVPVTVPRPADRPR